MIEMKFNPWQEVIDIVEKRWPSVKAEIIFDDTEWEWSAFPTGTVWYPEGSDTALIRVSYNVPFMETVEILSKSLGYLAFNIDMERNADMLNDAKAETYVNWIYDEYMRRVKKTEGEEG